MEALWPVITVLGPILLIAAIVAVYLRNRRASRSEIARAEQGAKDLREDLEREDSGES